MGGWGGGATWAAHVRASLRVFQLVAQSNSDWKTCNQNQQLCLESLLVVRTIQAELEAIMYNEALELERVLIRVLGLGYNFWIVLPPTQS